MPNESFPQQSKAERRTDPSLDEIHAMKARLEAEARFVDEALKNKLARQNADIARLENDKVYYFGIESGSWKEDLHKTKAAEVAGAAAITLAALAMSGNEQAGKKAKQPEGKHAAAPKPSKHAPKIVTNPLQSRKHAGGKIKETVAQIPLAARGFNASHAPLSVDTNIREVPELPEVSREQETIARPEIMDMRLADIPAPSNQQFDSVPVPGLSFENSTPAVDNVAVAPVPQLDHLVQPNFKPNQPILETPTGTLPVPEISIVHEPEDVARLTRGEYRTIPVRTPDTLAHKTREVPPITLVPGDTTLEATPVPVVPPAPMPRRTPLPGSVPYRPATEIYDTTVFDFSKPSTSAPIKPVYDIAPAPKPKAVENKTGKGKIQVSLSEDPNAAGIPGVVYTPPAARTPEGRIDDSVFHQEHVALDTAGKPKFKTEISEEVKGELGAREDTYIRVPYEDGGYTTSHVRERDSIKLGEMKEYQKKDDRIVKLLGKFTGPEVLKFRLDDTALEKLQSYDLGVQKAYFDQVEKKEDIGPWLLSVKSKGTILIFDKYNRLIREAPDLFGKGKGDGLNTYTTEGDTSGKTTPVGTYFLKKNLSTGELGHTKNVWSMVLQLPDGTFLNQGLALHGEIHKDVTAQEKKIHSLHAEDNHETDGCQRVSEETMKAIDATLVGQEYYINYIFPEDTTVTYNILTRKIEKFDKKELTNQIVEGIHKFRDTHLVTYYPLEEVVDMTKAGQRAHEKDYRRDPKLKDKMLMPDTKPIKKIKLPRFK
jgi:hypothetical protein